MKKISSDKLIFDNSTFSNFARIEKLELIFNISENIFTTKEVIEEIKKGLNYQPKLGAVTEKIKQKKISIATLKKPESILLMDKVLKEGSLSRADCATLVLAKEMEGFFIADDERAIKKAKTEKVKVFDPDKLGLNLAFKNKFKSTVIILEILKKKRVISKREFEEIRELLRQESFHF